MAKKTQGNLSESTTDVQGSVSTAWSTTNEKKKNVHKGKGKTRVDKDKEHPDALLWKNICKSGLMEPRFLKYMKGKYGFAHTHGVASDVRTESGSLELTFSDTESDSSGDSDESVMIIEDGGNFWKKKNGSGSSNSKKNGGIGSSDRSEPTSDICLMKTKGVEVEDDPSYMEYLKLWCAFKEAGGDEDSVEENSFPAFMLAQKKLAQEQAAKEVKHGGGSKKKNTKSDGRK